MPGLRRARSGAPFSAKGVTAFAPETPVHSSPKARPHSSLGHRRRIQRQERRWIQRQRRDHIQRQRREPIPAWGIAPGWDRTGLWPYDPRTHTVPLSSQSVPSLATHHAIVTSSPTHHRSSFLARSFANPRILQDRLPYAPYPFCPLTLLRRCHHDPAQQADCSTPRTECKSDDGSHGVEPGDLQEILVASHRYPPIAIVAPIHFIFVRTVRGFLSL
jgi:hypothetical protein